jgi:hypothetical protein
VGRPVVVVNARADAMLQPKLRNRAMDYMKRRLEPIVCQVSLLRGKSRKPLPSAL